MDGTEIVRVNKERKQQQPLGPGEESLELHLIQLLAVQCKYLMVMDGQALRQLS